MTAYTRIKKQVLTVLILFAFIEVSAQTHPCDSITWTMTPNPFVDSLVIQLSGFTDDTVTLKVTDVYSTALHTFIDSSVISGDTGFIYGTDTLAPGIYLFDFFINEGLCHQKAVKLPVGVENVEASGKLPAYIPVSDGVLLLPDAVLYKQYVIFDYLGRRYAEGYIGFSAVSVSSLASGMYFLLVDGEAARFYIP